jgi:predicted GNAT family acetyltransferase
MELERPAHADDFLAAAGDFLTEREAEHNLILGLCSRLRETPRFYGEDPYYLVVRERQRVVASAMRTPPHNLILSETTDGRTTEAICDAVRETFPTLPGVLGPSDVAAAFVHAWQARTGVSARLIVAQRAYRAAAVSEPADVEGAMRPYTDADEEQVLGWLDAFAAEAIPGVPLEDAPSMLRHRLEDPDGGFVLWEDETPVSVAGFGGPTPNGIRIGPVYTPPELRGRGYGSAVTARLTQTLLDGGRRFCFLFTDLANPTSNSIYQRMGYQPVTDIDFWRFG